MPKPRGRGVKIKFDREYAVISCYPDTKGFECKVLGLQNFNVCIGKTSELYEPGTVIPKEKIYIITKTCGRVSLDEEERNVLLEILKRVVKKYERHFLAIVNYSGMYDKWTHTLELLPKIGRARRKKIEAMRPFNSLEEVNEKLKIDIIESFAKRLMSEILNEVDEKVFTRGLRAVAQSKDVH